MRALLMAELASAVAADKREAAERYRRAKEARAEREGRPDDYASVTVRFASGGDEQAVRRLAERDGRRAPAAPLLVAEVDGAVLAARSLADGASLADPFHHTAHLAELLALRSAHLRGEEPRPRRRPVIRRRRRRAPGPGRVPARAS